MMLEDKATGHSNGVVIKLRLKTNKLSRQDWTNVWKLNEFTAAYLTHMNSVVPNAETWNF